MDRHYKGVIWTNHALDRLKQRSIKQGDAWATLVRPDTSRYAEAKKAWIYSRNFKGTAIEVVAQRNERREWVVLSVWSRPAEARQSWTDKLIDAVIKLWRRKKHAT